MLTEEPKIRNNFINKAESIIIMQTISRIACLTALFLLFGCEYNLSEENFAEVEPPPEMRYFNLNLIPAGDTIKIFEKTNLKYSFNTDGLELLLAAMSLKDENWTFYSSEGYLTLEPKYNEYTIDTLSLSIYIKSGTGSIADHVGMEGYTIEKKWVVLIDGRPAPKIKPTKYINDDGFLVIEWPKCDYYSFVGYNLSCSSSGRIGPVNMIITDPSQNYFIDSLYVGGDYFITVSCRLENSFTWGETLEFYEEPPQLNVEELGYDSLRITWNQSPYNARYRLNLISSEFLYFNSREDTAITIAQPGFGKFRRFELCTRSMFQEEEPGSYCGTTSNKNYALGDRLIWANWPEFAYNSVEKVIYSNEYDQMKSFKVDDYSFINSVKINSLDFVGLYSCPTNSSKVGAISEYGIYVFDNKNLNSSTVVSIPVSGARSTDHFILTNNDKVAYAANKLYRLIDVKSKQVITTINIPDYPYYSRWACITTSQDALYMSAVTRNGIKLYRMGEGEADEIYSDTRSYLSAWFNPFQPDQLYLSLSDTGIEIRNPEDFSLTERIDIPAQVVIQNIDPETGNLLVTDYEYLYIIDIRSHNVLLKVPCYESKSWLYNNRLFTNTGFVLDVSENL